MKPSHYSIWDLDNCLANDEWRTWLIDWHLDGNERYNRYDSKMGEDAPENLRTWYLITQLSTPVFLTGRRETWRGVTERWIKDRLRVFRNGQMVMQDDPLVLMRANDDNRKPVEVKRDQLYSLGDHGVSLRLVIAAFDDVPAIVQMYRDSGLPALQLTVHNPLLAYLPQDL